MKPLRTSAFCLFTSLLLLSCAPVKNPETRTATLRESADGTPPQLDPRTMGRLEDLFNLYSPPEGMTPRQISDLLGRFEPRIQPIADTVFEFDLGSGVRYRFDSFIARTAEVFPPVAWARTTSLADPEGLRMALRSTYPGAPADALNELNDGLLGFDSAAAGGNADGKLDLEESLQAGIAMGSRADADLDAKPGWRLLYRSLTERSALARAGTSSGVPADDTSRRIEGWILKLRAARDSMRSAGSARALPATSRESTEDTGPSPAADEKAHSAHRALLAFELHAPVPSPTPSSPASSAEQAQALSLERIAWETDQAFLKQLSKIPEAQRHALVKSLLPLTYGELAPALEIGPAAMAPLNWEIASLCEAIFSELDTDHDGFLSAIEARPLIGRIPGLDENGLRIFLSPALLRENPWFPLEPVRTIEAGGRIGPSGGFIRLWTLFSSGT